jgi:hypothetical protein
LLVFNYPLSSSNNFFASGAIQIIDKDRWKHKTHQKQEALKSKFWKRLQYMEKINQPQAPRIKLQIA